MVKKIVSLANFYLFQMEHKDKRKEAEITCIIIMYIVNNYIMDTIIFIVDSLFKFTLLFLFNLIWCIYFFKKNFVRWIVTIALTIIEYLTIYIINKKKCKKSNLSKLEQQRIKDILNTFIYMPQSETIDFFYNLLCTKHSPSKFEKYIYLLNNNKNIVLFFNIKIDKLSTNEFSEIIKSLNNKNLDKLIVLCNGYDKDLEMERNNIPFEVIFLSKEEIYFQLLKKYEFYPQILLKKQKNNKKTYKYILFSVFNKKNTRRYFISGTCLFLASFFSPLKFYYVLVSSLLIVFAIVSYFNFSSLKANNFELFD